MTAQVDDWELIHASPDAEMFCAPSDEAERLLRRMASILAPRDGAGSRASQVLRALIVAPFTQLAFGSFDLQVFLLDVLHTKPLSRQGHLVGMTGVNFFVLALLAFVGGSWAAIAYAVTLLGWYAAVARQARLGGWWATMLPLVGALAAGASLLAHRVASPLPLLVGLLLSGVVVTLPHAFEPKLPPRSGHPHEWRSLGEFVLGLPGDRHGPVRIVRNAIWIGLYPVVGLVNELWASPRLMPYNVLRAMMALGYAPDLKAVLDARRDRALASGNPALDYVGIGGGTFIRPRAAPRGVK